MRKKSGTRIIDSENPEWSAADFRRARPSREVVPRIVDAYLKRRGRPTQGDGTKVQVTLRLDPAILAHFRSKGTGWQTQINDTLMKVVRLKVAARKK